MANIVDALTDSEKKCVGCSSCMNTCPKNAISIVTNERGFLRPSVDPTLCIDCGKCVKGCPALNSESPKGNMKQPRSYAFVAEDRILSRSSSGGVFYVLADWALRNNGCVCGTVYDDDFNVVYKLTDDRKVISRMHGSKYVVSDMGTVYKDVKECLDSGRMVLFFGLPCHVSALKMFIGENENLYTIDLICSGLPSKTVFQQYLREQSEGRKIKDVLFRRKGLPYGTMVIRFDDGTSKVNYNDAFIAGFNRSLYKNECCTKCDFAAPPRQADLTIGDLWESEKMFHDFDSSKGVSCALVNNASGRKLLSVLSKHAAFLKEVPYDFVKRFNRLNPTREAHLAQPRLYHMLENGHSVEKSVKYCLKWKFDVGITGLWRAPNYGGNLTYYALFHIIEDLGLEPAMIEARSKDGGRVPMSPKRLMNRYPMYCIVPWAHDKDHQMEINHRVYTLLVGSDQVWNADLFPNNPEILLSYALDFAASWRNTVAYASSFGKSVLIPGTDVEKAEVEAIRNIKHVSVREKSGVGICSSFGVEATHVLDPMMLCDMKHYMRLLDTATITVPERYGLCFVRHTGDHMDPNRLSNYLDLPFLNVAGPGIDLNTAVTDYPLINVETVENWVKTIYRSDYVLTDSFHGAALSIVFGKQFIAVYGAMSEESGLDRFKSLLGMFGLEDRLYPTTMDALTDHAYSRTIDYGKVHQRLDELRASSLSWLKDALEIDLNGQSSSQATEENPS